MKNGKHKGDIIKTRRAQLTRAAYQVVGRKGYHNFTIRDIASTAGLSTGLVHYYFKDKQDLLLNLIREMTKNLFVYLYRALDAAPDDPAEKMRIFVRQAFNLVNDEKDYFSVMIDFWSQASRSERMKKANVKLLQSYRDECERILREGMDRGAFREMDVPFTGALIISLIQGMIIQYVIDNGAFDYGTCTAKALDHVMSLILKDPGR